MGKWKLIPITLAALAACQTATPTPPLTVPLAFEPPNTCRIIVEGQALLVWPDYESSVPALKAAAAKSQHATIVSDINVPYKCVGAAIIAAQQAGFKRVEYAAGPPPTH